MKAKHRKELLKSFVSKLMASPHIDFKSGQSSEDQKANLKRALKDVKEIADVSGGEYENAPPNVNYVTFFSNYTEAATNLQEKDKPMHAVIAGDYLHIGKFAKVKKGPPREEIQFDSSYRLKLGENEEDWKPTKTSKKINIPDIILGLNIKTSYNKMNDSLIVRLNNAWSISMNLAYFDRIQSQETSQGTSQGTSKLGKSQDYLLQYVKNAETSVSRTNSICDDTRTELMTPIDLNNDGQSFYVDWSYLDDDKILPLDFAFDSVKTDDGIKLVPDLSENPVLVMKKRGSVEKILKRDKLAKCIDGGKSSDGGEPRKRNIGFKPITEPNIEYWICELADEWTEKIYSKKIFHDEYLKKLSTVETFTHSPSTVPPSTVPPTTVSPNMGSPNNREDNEQPLIHENEQSDMEIPNDLQEDTFPILLRQIFGFREIFEIRLNDDNQAIEAYFTGEIIFK